MNIHYEILDQKRIDILPQLVSFRELGFYLAGGTALALQIGHRDSIDFDFFCPEAFATATLFNQIEKTFAGHKISKVQDELNTLEIIIDESIRLSFMTYPYPLVAETVNTPWCNMASITDIGCMKLSAITSRTTYKDYVDLYFILQEVSLASLILHLQNKLPTLDPTLALKSLVYFADITPEEILYKVTPVAFETIKLDLEQKAKDLNT